MADFIELKEEYLPKDGDWYKVSGTIIDDDIKKINSFQRRTVLVIDNTKDLSSEIVGRITSSNISFSVVGGLDYFNKQKYKDEDYIFRTLMSPLGLAEVIKYYEGIESQMLPEWTDIQKSMFLYAVIVEDFFYREHYDSIIGSKMTSRSLNGILYKLLVCAGFALVFKEGLDRLGINNVYQNKKGRHSWNIVELGGAWRGMEITGECASKFSDNMCRFERFALESSFYENKARSLLDVVEIQDDDYWENSFESYTPKTVTISEEEDFYNLVPFTREELKANYDVIAPVLQSRRANSSPLFNSSDQEIRMLPFDQLRVTYQKQASIEHKFILLYEFLKNSSNLGEEQYEFLNVRRGFISDVLVGLSYGLDIGNTSSFSGRDIGVSSLEKCQFSNNGDFMAPFGMKHTFRDIEQINDAQALDSAFVLLRERLREYSKDYLVGLLSDSESLLSNYQKFKTLSVERDLNLSIVETDLYTKLNTLVVGKGLLLVYGIPQEEVEEKIGRIQSYFDSINEVSTLLDAGRVDGDLDFLYSVFEDVKDVRKCCEQFEGHELTETEWLQKCRDAKYMLRVFDKLSAKEGDVQSVLDDIFGAEHEDNHAVGVKLK